MRVSVLAVALLCCQSLSAQTYIRVGPSALANYHGFFERVYSNIGGEVSAEFSMTKKLTVNVPVVAHYGEHKNYFDESVTTKNRLFGISPEIRYHPSKSYHGMFYGIGGEIKHLTSFYNVPPWNNFERPYLVNWEYNLGLTVGQNETFQKGVLTPYVYLGFGAINNEYSVNARVGCTYGFVSKPTTMKRFTKRKTWQ